MTEATSTTQSDRLHSALNALSELLAEIHDQGPDDSLREGIEAAQGAANYVTDWLTETLERVSDEGQRHHEPIEADSTAKPRMLSHAELVTALANLEWLVRNRDATFDLRSNTVVSGDGGFAMDSLLERDLTPATRPERQ